MPRVLTYYSIKYTRSGHYRAICVDGSAWQASPSSPGVRVVLYSERFAAPLPTAARVDENDQVALSRDDQGEFDEYVERELESELVLSPAAARALHRVLGDYLGRDIAQADEGGK